jgi:hypothetical protein
MSDLLSAPSSLLQPRQAACRPVSRVEAGDKDERPPVPDALGLFCQRATRAIAVILGLTAVAWGIHVLPVFTRQAPIERVATQLVDGGPFKPEVLLALMPQVGAAEKADPCRPAAVRSAAIIRTRVAEQAIVSGENIDAELSALNDSIRRSLSCSPADPFLWFMLYWTESIRNGFQPNYLEYLRLSYQLGPNEGWIAVKRNRYALAIFQTLPPDLASQVVSEFAGLVHSGFVAETVASLEGPGWNVRERLLAGLKDVPERNREVFAKVLYHDGYNVTVPGIMLAEPRPWD